VKLLGLDVGDTRIGLAVAEKGRPIAFGRGWITRSSEASDTSAILELANAENAEIVVVGLPIETSGKEGSQAIKVRRFAQNLRRAGLKVEFFDERFTTRLAKQRLTHLSRKKRQEKGRLDEAAAIAILEGYLERNQ